MISRELQIGKAGEHLVCADLIYQGYQAFLSDQGLSYDVLVDLGYQIYKIQVKTTTQLVTYDKATQIYRYGLRRAKGARARFSPEDADIFAFVAMDIRTIAYLPVNKVLARTGNIKQTMDFKSRHIEYIGKKRLDGTLRKVWGKCLEDHTNFPYIIT